MRTIKYVLTGRAGNFDDCKDLQEKVKVKSVSWTPKSPERISEECLVRQLLTPA